MSPGSDGVVSLPMSVTTGIEQVSAEVLVDAERQWTGNDQSARQYHARMPMDLAPFTLALNWRELPSAPAEQVGTFRLNLEILLAHDLVYEDGPGKVRVRFVHAKDGNLYLQGRSSGPRVLVGAGGGELRDAEPKRNGRVENPRQAVGSPAMPVTGARAVLKEFQFDGTAALEHALAHSPYGSLENAVASLSLFTHPDTVRQTGARALFRIIRGRVEGRGTIVDHADGNRVLLDDNTGPTDAFIWANGLSRGEFGDLQFCHVWQASSDPEAYTNLANLCLLPAFLAKLSDTHPRITKLLRWRAESLYGWRPAGEPPTEEPESAGRLDWAEPLPAVGDLEAVVRSEMRTKRKSRTAISAREIGWVFSGYGPDESLTAR